MLGLACDLVVAREDLGERLAVGDAEVVHVRGLAVTRGPAVALQDRVDPVGLAGGGVLEEPAERGVAEPVALLGEIGEQQRPFVGERRCESGHVDLRSSVVPASMRSETGHLMAGLLCERREAPDRPGTYAVGATAAEQSGKR